ncbi:hypothetical protein HPB52_002795 [Rhipicephalus sanguineus]|uniref:Uncharacterized protein n=1 Tax=Rhipicephalus sanguineus TaxID=34632 RepID=A0A9D4Q8R1_RHISA|nr:hypothetical protein HPB52_002795 [Rhipicephalus sanguineus]
MRRGSMSEDDSVHGSAQVVAPESRRNERFGDLKPERRLVEFRAEMETLSQGTGGSARDSEHTFSRRDQCGEQRR